MSAEKQPQTPPAGGPPNFNELEKGILKFWDDNRIFEKSLEITKSGKPYVFFDGPPFATGLPHYGHILGSTVKDVFGRYHTMKGEYVRRRWGWDCHGLPIENIVEGKLKISGKKQIEDFGVDKFNAECKSSVLAYAEEWGKMVSRMGRWVEFENSYKTMDATYMESVWWALKQIWDKHLIYEDRKVLLYCSRCETPISNFEVAMDNSYKDVTEESVYAKFKMLKGQRIGNDLTNNKTYALAWTTTPWTLPGNTSLNVGPDIAYVMIEAENKERYILAKERLSIIDGAYELVAEFPARALEGLMYEPLYPGVIPSGRGVSSVAEGTPLPTGMVGDPNRAHRFYLADFVTTTDGTGIVHNAAMYGEEDYQLAKEKNLPRVDMLDHKGQYLPIAPEHLRGVMFKDADPIVLKDLSAKDLIYKTENYLHSYPHCWRCGTPLFYNALPAWFINIQKIKPRLRELNQQQMNWYPEHLKMGRFDKSMAQAPDWNISRNRFWATPLPFWKCGADGCKNVVCVGSIQELREKSINFAEVYPEAAGSRQQESVNSTLNPQPSTLDIDLHRPYIDRVVLKCDKCGGEMHRIPEVVDCWVESASMPFAEFHYPFENKEEFEKRTQADFVAEYIAQTRAWFYVMHVISTIVFDKAPFKNVVTTGTVLAEDGSKMSKSKNNYPDPNVLIEKYGIDAVRFYLLASPVMNADDLNFSEKGVVEVSRKVSLLLYNVWSFYRMYETTRNHADPTATAEPRGNKSENVLDKWVLSRLAQAQTEVTKQLESYNTVKAGKIIIDFINDLSTWYLRRSRDRIKSQNEDAKQALDTLGFVLAEFSKILAPFMPFLADFIYKDITGKESVHLAVWSDMPAPADEKLIASMELVREAVSLGMAVRKDKALPVRQPLSALALDFSSADVNLPPELTQLILEELNVKKFDSSLLDKNNRGTGVAMAPGAAGIKNFYLDLNLTAELKAEGLARELERQVQDLRKKSGLKVGELVDLYYNTQEPALEESLLKLLDRKKTFISQISKSLEVEVDFEIQAEVGGKAVWLGIVKI